MKPLGKGINIPLFDETSMTAPSTAGYITHPIGTSASVQGNLIGSGPRCFWTLVRHFGVQLDVRCQYNIKI